jgi:hypothetical protein
MLGTQHGHLDITRHVAPDQARFECDGPPLFNLIGQCLQDVGLTELNKVIGKQFLNDNDLAKASFKK